LEEKKEEKEEKEEKADVHRIVQVPLVGILGAMEQQCSSLQPRPSLQSAWDLGLLAVTIRTTLVPGRIKYLYSVVRIAHIC